MNGRTPVILSTVENPIDIETLIGQIEDL